MPPTSWYPTRVRPTVLLALAVAAAGVAACKEPPPAPPPAAEDASHVEVAPVHVVAVPPPRPANGFVGSLRCQECHAKEHAAWARDWHHRALAPATASSVVGSFAAAHFRGASSEAWMRTDGARRVMRTAGLSGSVDDYAVDWVIGGKRMQDTVHVFPDGRWQVMPVYFHVTRASKADGDDAARSGPRAGEWVDYTEAKQGTLTPDHPFYWTNFRRTANRECLDCHTTGLEVTYARATRAWTTTFADGSVGCESCHGPGERHAASLDPDDVFQPGKASRDAKTAVCAQCHGPRNPLFPILDAAERFRPGERYDDSYEAVVVLLGDGRSGDFFADGRPKTSSFEYQAMIQSRCFMKSAELTCLTCHAAPHAPHVANEIRSMHADGGAPAALALDRADATCAGCHAAVVAKGVGHTHHRAVGCVNCHMPSTVTGVLDHFADHAIDVPNPANTERHGVPSACGACHEGRPPGELQAWLLQQWPGAAARQARRVRLADAFDPATATRSRGALVATVSDADEAPTLRAAALTLLATQSPADVRELAVPLLHHAEALLRARAATALAMARVTSAKDAIARNVADPSLPVAEATALALAALGDRRGVAALDELVRAPRTSRLFQPQLALGIARARGGDVRGAVPLFRRAVEVAPYASDAMVMLSDALLRTGHESEARPWLEEALRFDPSHEAAKERLKTIEAGGR
jgi:hypothetical protein